MSSGAVAATAAVVDDLVNEAAAGDAVAVPEEPVVEAPAATVNDEIVEDEPDEMPADLKALLEDDDDDDPVSFEPPDVDDEYATDDDGFEDPDELRRRLAKTEKKLKHYEEQRLRSERKNWEKEIARYWPLADAKKIAAEASSRKDAVRKAAAEHSYVEPKVAKAEEKWAKWAKEEIARQVAEREKQLEQAWGRPIGGPGTVPVAQAVEADVQAQIQNARTLQERTALKLRYGVTNL